MRENRNDTFDRRAHAVRWPFAVRMVDAPPLITPDFQFSLDRILRTTRLYLLLEGGMGREFGERRYSRR